MLFRSSRHVLVIGQEPGKQPRTYTADIEGGTFTPIMPEGTVPQFLSRDGKIVVARNADGLWGYSVDGGSPWRINGVQANETPLQLTTDGKGLYVSETAGVGARILRVDVGTGRRELVRELTPPNLAGSMGISRVVITPGGETYVYGYGQQLSELYLARGIR